MVLKMEYTIDRSSYRRHSEIEKEDDDETKKFGHKLIKKLAIQSIASILIILMVFALKLFKVQNAVEWINQEAKKDVPLPILYESAKTKILELYAKIQKNDEEKQNVENENSGELDELEAASSIQTDISTEPIYESAVEGVNQLSEDAKYVKENYKFIYPIKGQVTSGFGVRQSSNPIVTPYHSGIDLAANTGTKIQSALSGTVIKAETNESYGKHIMIQTGDLILVYAHCSKLNVKVDQKVKQGDIIGEVGSTGWATGPHLHFEIRRDDRLVNPADILNFEE